MNTPGQRIRDARESKNLSQGEVATLSNLRLEYYQQIEDDDLPAVHSRTYLKIGDALGVTLGMILGTEEVKASQELQDDVPDEYKWVVKNTMRLIVVFGTLLLLAGIIFIGAFGIRLLLDLLA